MRDFFQHFTAELRLPLDCDVADRNNADEFAISVQYRQPANLLFLRVALGSRPWAVARMVMSRSVTMPASRWPSRTGKAPTSSERIFSAASWMEASGRTPLLYGGSVTPENVASLLACPNVDGGLVGGASLKPDGFLALLQAGANAT